MPMTVMMEMPISIPMLMKSVMMLITTVMVLLQMMLQIFPTWYIDSDDDGHGSDEDTLILCDAPDGYINNMTDCDDMDPSTNPDALKSAIKQTMIAMEKSMRIPPITPCFIKIKMKMALEIQMFRKRHAFHQKTL